jgi:hypothetical protein
MRTSGQQLRRRGEIPYRDVRGSTDSTNFPLKVQTSGAEAQFIYVPSEANTS